MMDYGFRAVRTSLHAMNQAIVENSVQSMTYRGRVTHHQSRPGAQTGDV